jgi:hypothetical protein
MSSKSSFMSMTDMMSRFKLATECYKDLSSIKSF